MNPYFQALSPQSQRALLAVRTLGYRTTDGFDLFKDVFRPIGRFVEGAVLKPVGDLLGGVTDIVGDIPLVGDLLSPVTDVVGDIVRDPLGSVAGVLSNIPIVGDIANEALGAVAGLTGIEEGYFGSKAMAPLDPARREFGVQAPSDYANLAPGVLTPRQVAALPADSTPQSVRAYAQQILGSGAPQAGTVTITYNPQAQYTAPGAQQLPPEGRTAGALSIRIPVNKRRSVRRAPSNGDLGNLLPFNNGGGQRGSSGGAGLDLGGMLGGLLGGGDGGGGLDIGGLFTDDQGNFVPGGNLTKSVVTDAGDILRGLVTPPPRQRPQGQPGPCSLPPGAHPVVPCSWGAIARGDQVTVPQGTVLVVFSGAQFTGEGGAQAQSGGTPFNFGSAIVLPAFPFADALVAGLDALVWLAQNDCAGFNPSNDPLVQSWNSLAATFAQYVGGTPFQGMLDGLRAEAARLGTIHQQACGQTAQQRLPIQQQQAQAGACPSGEVFRHAIAGQMREACIPQNVVDYCESIDGTYTASVRGDGSLVPYCRPPMRKRDVVTKIGEGHYMVQPRINPVGGRAVVRRRPVGALPAPAAPQTTGAPQPRLGYGGTSLSASRGY